MKTLILMRHGNAADAYDDFARQLTNVGRMRATETGRRICATGLKVSAVICSDALRAKTTAQIVSREVGAETIVERHFLYSDYTTDDFLGMLEQIGDSSACAECLVVVGHNPYISYNANTLLGKAYFGFAPAEAVGISFDVDRWGTIAPGSGRLGFSIEHSLL